MPDVTVIYQTGVVGQCPHGVDIIAVEHPPENGMISVTEHADCEQCREEYTEKLRSFLNDIRDRSR